VLTKSGPSSREVANGSGEVVGELDEEVDSRAYRVLKKTSGFYAASSAEGSGEVAGEVEIEEKRRDVEEKTRDLEDPPTTNVSQLRSGSGVWVVSGVDPESGKRFSDQFRDRVDAEEHALDVAGLGAVDIRVEERVG
jgi:hypothetical protein